MSQVSYQDIKIGILGGGQLGRMLIQSATDFNLDIHILDPDQNAPAKHLTGNFTCGSLKDFDSVYNFGKHLDLVTIEIESVNTEALKKLEVEGVKVFPQPHLIELIQDKRIQKDFYLKNHIPTAEFVLTDNRQDVERLADFLPAVHKLGKDGYDGRGVQVLRTEADIHKAFDQPGLLEKLVDFQLEISVIVARNERGEIKAFPTVGCAFHPDLNLVEYLFAPSGLSDAIEQKAEAVAIEVIDKLQLVGLLAVEMFGTRDGQILVMEIAPRPHNSGHHTIEANITSQFEQHLRAILGMPLGDTSIIQPAAMVNLLGEDGYSGDARYIGMDEAMATSGVHVHLYGKKVTKPFRKMGHVTVVGETIEQVEEKAKRIRNLIKIIA